MAKMTRYMQIRVVNGTARSVPVATGQCYVPVPYPYMSQPVPVRTNFRTKFFSPILTCCENCNTHCQNYVNTIYEMTRSTPWKGQFT